MAWKLAASCSVFCVRRSAVALRCDADPRAVLLCVPAGFTGAAAGMIQLRQFATEQISHRRRGRIALITRLSTVRFRINCIYASCKRLSRSTPSPASSAPASAWESSPSTVTSFNMPGFPNTPDCRLSPALFSRRVIAQRNDAQPLLHHPFVHVAHRWQDGTSLWRRQWRRPGLKFAPFDVTDPFRRQIDAGHEDGRSPIPQAGEKDRQYRGCDGCHHCPSPPPTARSWRGRASGRLADPRPGNTGEVQRAQPVER